MNKIYKLVWSACSRSYVVTSEAASSRGGAPSEVRAVVAALAGMLLAGQAMAVCDDLVVSAPTSSPVIADCNNRSITVNANIDAPGLTGLTNVDGSINLNLTSLTIASGVSVGGNDALILSSATVSGDITNDGTLDSYWSGGGSGFGGPGMSLNDMTIDGAIINSGTIHGGYSGIALTSSTAGLLQNSGTITALGYGLDLNNSSYTEIRNEASGLIHGDNRGINIAGISSVELLDNSGSISSGGAGVDVYGHAILTKIMNRQGGSISGDRSGIDIDYDGTVGDLENAGQISGRIGVQSFGGTLSGTLDNKSTGVIQGDNVGINLQFESHVNAIINEGSISGGLIGIDGLEGSVISNGIVNSGTISGGDFAIRVNANDGASLDRIDLVGASASLVGDVDAANTEVNVKSEGAFTTTNAFNVRSFNVESGGTLTLTDAAHTMNGLSVNGITVSEGFFNNGTVVVGASTQGRVNGNYTQNAGGALTVGVDGVANHGVLAVSGNALLANGATLNVNVGNNANFSGGERIAGVVTAGGTLTVNTATGLTVQDNSVLYKFSADTSRAANELDLLVGLDQAPFVNNVGSGITPLGGVAANLDQILAAGVPQGLQSALDRLSALPANELPSAMSQLVPVMTGAGSQAGVSALRSMNKIIQSRVESNQGLSAGSPASERYMWVRAFGSSGEQTSQDVVAGFRSNAKGLVLGGDTPVNDKLRAGFAFTYAHSDIDSRGSGAPSSLNVNTFELVHYGSYNLDAATDINYQLDAGYNGVKGVRQILFMSQQANSDFSSLNLHGSVGIGRSWSVAPQSSLTPSVRLDYTHMKTGSYTETGAGALNLQVDDSTFKEFMLTADLKGAHNLSEHTKLVGNVSAGYDFSNKQSVTSSAFVGGGSVFETKGLDSSAWLYRAGFGLLHDASSMEYTLRYDLERRTSGYTNQTLSARARWAF